ncbi:hypothetical protein SLS62_001192 [Diatrype stigma]|uniref:LYC1 C-terminal domain-containing protein n=1 Tax=Diatrype stigma TaxID=117547 RepID=A0AAN9V8Z3_9PEZI
MGSQANNNDAKAPPLPDATSETLVLTRPTDEEKRRTWTLNYREWGGALSLDQYLQREPYVTTIPLSRDGGMAHWILTTQAQGTTASPPSLSPSPRPVLASCESIRKRVLVARPPPSPRGGGGGSGGSDADDGAQVTEAIGYGIGSVYTYPECRGRSYAKRMLKELGVALKKAQPGTRDDGAAAATTTAKAGAGGGQEASRGGQDPGSGSGSGLGSEPQVVCSALWSDIGKRFYASKGWHPFPSVHVSFPASSNSSITNPNPNPRVALEPITYANLASLAALDEAQLRRRLARTAARTGRTAFAFAPDHDALRWHLYRDGFVAAFVHGGAAAEEEEESAAAAPPGEMKTKGVVATTAASGEEKRRVWAVWARNYQARPTERPEDRARKNTLYILRLVVEGADEDAGEGGDGDGEQKALLREALAAVLGAARAEAARWDCGKVDLWNPTPLVRRLLEGIADGGGDGGGDGVLPREWVDRDTDSIPSLMWYGLPGDGGEEEGEGEGEVEWVANEKYCWC